MKLERCVCLALVGAVLFATQAVANTPLVNQAAFLKVDINGFNSGGGEVLGGTEPGFDFWDVPAGTITPWVTAAAGISKTFLTSQGNISVNMRGIAPSSTRSARNRNAAANPPILATDDFVFANRGLGGFGRHYIRLEITGLQANQDYQFTGWARENFNGVATDTLTTDPNGRVSCNCTSWQAWSDLTRLDVDGPDAWMDANVGMGALYQPTYPSSNDPNEAGFGVYKNPIPTEDRSQISGGAPTTYYQYSGSLFTRTDATGKAVVYTWSDPQGYSGTQTVSLLNGFEIRNTPEPGSLALALLGLASIAGIRRRDC